MLHGFPVSSSASRTALASSAGARSQAYSLAAGTVVLAVLLFLSPLHPQARGIVFALARVKQDLMNDLEAYGLADSVGAAVAAYRTWTGAQ